jgi:hypothetical protein
LIFFKADFDECQIVIRLLKIYEEAFGHMPYGQLPKVIFIFQQKYTKQIKKTPCEEYEESQDSSAKNKK